MSHIRATPKGMTVRLEHAGQRRWLAVADCWGTTARAESSTVDGAADKAIRQWWDLVERVLNNQPPTRLLASLSEARSVCQ